MSEIFFNKFGVIAHIGGSLKNPDNCVAEPVSRTLTRLATGRASRPPYEMKVAPLRLNFLINKPSPKLSKNAAYKGTNLAR